MSKANVIKRNSYATLVKLADGTYQIKDSHTNQPYGAGNGPTQAWANAWANIEAMTKMHAERTAEEVRIETAPKLPRLSTSAVMAHAAIAPMVRRVAPPLFSAEFQQLRGTGRYGKPTRAAMAQR